MYRDIYQRQKRMTDIIKADAQFSLKVPEDLQHEYLLYQ